MNDAAPPRRIWLCADDYGLSPGVNRGIRDLIERGRLNATSVMVVGPAIGRDEASALGAVAANSPRCSVGLHVTLTAPFRPLTMHFQPLDGGMFLPFPKVLRAGLLRRLDPEIIQALARRLGAPKGLVLDVLSAQFRRRAARAEIAFNSGFAGAYDFTRQPDFSALMRQFLDGLPEDGVIMCHPGFVDETLVSLDPFTTQREHEHAFLGSEHFPRLLAANKVTLG